LDYNLVVRVVVICALLGALSGLFVMWFNREKLRRQQQFIKWYFYAAFFISCLVILGFLVLVILRQFGHDYFPV
jgi:H+/Cl- antiporter ClcA